ncbi:MAG: hypothetical protein NC131_11315 [Roseburia sp.]|nr:hypothetical protein [Roseburia sp.]
MGTSVNIGGVYRKMWPSRVMIDGVWRSDDSYAMINGVWRKTYEHNISASNIIGVRIIYVRDPAAKSDEYPELRSTKQLPVRMHLTGDTRGNMDLNDKGIIFEYDHDHPTWEGICLYRATMYVELVDGTILAVNPRTGPNLWDTPDLCETTIQINGYEFYESYGYYISGWNSICHKKQFIKDDNFTDKGQVKKFNLLNQYNILPATLRDDDFDSGILIGISRSLRNDGPNMVGSYGVLDHTYREILINGEPKPFVIEIYH